MCTSNRTTKPHIFIMVYPVQGRLIPAMSLASHLADSGAEVSFFYPLYYESRMSEAKKRTHKGSISLIALESPDEPPGPNEVEYITKSVQQSFEAYLQALPQLPACLISDEVYGSIAKVARKFSIPRYALVPQSATAFSMTMYAPKLAEEQRLPLKQDDVIDIPPLKQTFKYSEFLSVYLDTMPTQVHELFLHGALETHHTNGIFINTVSELDNEVISVLNTDQILNPKQTPVVPIGPLIEGVTCEEQHITEFLNRREPGSVVFVSFGSLRTSEEEEAREIFKALTQTGYPFIWMLRCKNEYIPPPTENGLVLQGWAPQTTILSHPSTGLFITHCGWNSSLETLYCGVPVIGFPSFMDQYINCNRLVNDLQVGVRLDRLDESSIVSSVRTVMESEEIKENARKWKAVMNKAISVAKERLTSFVESLRARKEVTS